MQAYISQNADNRIIEALTREGFEVHLLAPFDALSAPTDTHADMLILKVDKTVFVPKNYELPSSLSPFYNVVEIEEEMCARYPFDVALNIAIVGKHTFLNKKHASKTVLKYLEAYGYSIHHVAQGYAHCSTLIVSGNAIITADEGITASAREVGIDVLKISAGHISLPPYDYGFIGGASGVTDDAVYFCGSLKYHPDGDKIRLFVENHGKKVVELVDAPLSDVGGILFSNS